MKKILLVVVPVVLVAAAAIGACGTSLRSSGPAGLLELAQSRGLSPEDAARALKTFVPPGGRDEYMLFASGGHSGQVHVIGVPSMRLLKTIAVFTPEPWQGYGYGADWSESALGEKTPRGPNAADPVVTLSGTTNSSLNFTVPAPTTSSGFGASPSATFQVTASNGTNQDTKTVKVTFYASFNNLNAAISTSATVYGKLGSCMSGSCHGGTSNTCSSSIGYGMGSTTAFLNNSVNVSSCVGGRLRVDTTNGPNSSELILRLKGTGAGQQMPKGQGALPGSDIGLIADWISQGASSSN